MKLRNKFTGEIGEFSISQGDDWENLTIKELQDIELQKAKKIKKEEIELLRDQKILADSPRSAQAEQAINEIEALATSVEVEAFDITQVIV